MGRAQACRVAGKGSQMRFQLIIHSGNGNPHPMAPDTAGGTFREMEGFREDMLNSTYTVCPGNHNLFERIKDGRIVLHSHGALHRTGGEIMATATQLMTGKQYAEWLLARVTEMEPKPVAIKPQMTEAQMLAELEDLQEGMADDEYHRSGNW
jgi:hypothetical protein